MREQERGRVIPFGMSGMRLRRSAQEYRRCGQPLEALSLVRRAAQQDDTAAGWHALAVELKQLSCWEAASRVLARTLSRPDAPASAWLDMARCMLALGQTDTAEDCLYHLLYDDPWSKKGDTARVLLQSLDEEKAEKQNGRGDKLIGLALNAWQRGEHALGRRRMERAVRLVKHKEQPLTALAVMHMSEGRDKETLHCLARAVNAAPDDPMPLCTMATVLSQRMRMRMARGLLGKAASLCRETQQEERFCSLAWMLDAWPELDSFLAVRLKRTPYRIPLLHARARMLNERGSMQAARDTWRLILSIDPDDRQAAALLAWTQEQPGGVLPPGQLPAQVMRMQLRTLTQAQEPFRPGSDERRVLDWAVASGDAREAEAAFAASARSADRAQEALWLRETMMRPDVPELQRRQAVQRLTELGSAQDAGVLVAGRYMTVQQTGGKAQTSRMLWRMHLPVLLRVVGRDERCSEIVAYAAQMWKKMTDEERQAAASQEAVSWSRVFQLLWLWQQGRSQEAEEIVARLKMPLRRFQRLVNMALLAMDKEAGDAGEGDT